MTPWVLLTTLLLSSTLGMVAKHELEIAKRRHAIMWGCVIALGTFIILIVLATFN